MAHRSQPPPPPSSRHRRLGPPPRLLSLPPAPAPVAATAIGAEEDAFFQVGDAGTYAGGPAESIAPVALGELLSNDEGAIGLSPELALRRRQWQRAVTSVVATLGAACLVLFSFQLGRMQGEKRVRNDEPSHGVLANTSIQAPPSQVEAPPAEEPGPARRIVPEGVLPSAVRGPSKPRQTTRDALPPSHAARGVTASFVPTGQASFGEPKSPRSLAPSVFVGAAARDHGRTPPTASFPD